MTDETREVISGIYFWAAVFAFWAALYALLDLVPGI